MQYFPVLDVHINNIVAVWPSIKLGIDTAEFIALDLELSGLGDRKKLSSKCLEERYKEISETAKTRSIISVGISIFRHQCEKVTQSGEGGEAEFVVQTYNLLALCSQPYIVEPEALKFLTRHGFDFNKQYTTGLSYSKPSTNVQMTEVPSLGLLFQLLTAANKPIILHNGLVDLIFLYQNFYLDLPAKLSTFLADVEDLFSAGVHDTKYLAEYHLRTTASYLQYVFRSCLEWAEGRIQLTFLQPPASDDVYHVALVTRAEDADSTSQAICQQYASHGWCSNAAECTKSHDISLIVGADKLNRTASKNRKRRLKEKERKKRLKRDSTAISEEVSDEFRSIDDIPNPFLMDQTKPLAGADSNTDISTNQPNLAKSLENTNLDTNVTKGSAVVLNCHRAGVDAFMTGLCYAVFATRLSEKGVNVYELRNQLYLSGKSLPLQVTKGNFGRVSQSHAQRSQLLKSQANFASVC